MSTSTFVQPNSNTMVCAAYPPAVDDAVAVMAHIGAAFAPHAQAEPDMTVAVDAGNLTYGNTLVQMSEQTSASLTAPVSDPRYDLLVVDRSTAEVSVVTGTEAASPELPALPSGMIPLAQIALGVGMEAITNADITDLRPLWRSQTSPLPVAEGGTGASSESAARDNLGLDNTYGQCRLLLSGGNLLLKPQNGNKITIDGEARTIPSAGVALSASGTAAATLYYIYAAVSEGAIVLEASTTAHATDASTGIEIKSGDAAKTLVGMAYVQTAEAWPSSALLMASWFNRAPAAGFKSTGAVSTTGWITVVTDATTSIPFVCWADQDIVTINSSGYAVNTIANGGGNGQCALDDVPVGAYCSGIAPQFSINSTFASTVSEGYHLAGVSMGAPNGGTTSGLIGYSVTVGG